MQGRDLLKTRKSGYSEDLPYSQGQLSVDNLASTCFCVAPHGRKRAKEHHYWSLVENKRVGGGRVVQRHVLYLGEINSSQQEAWRKSIEIFEEGKARPTTVALFPEERIGPAEDASIVRLRLDDIALRRPRQWGACWLGCHLYEKLGLWMTSGPNDCRPIARAPGGI